MAIFLRGNVWWFEWRRGKERVVKSTGFRKPDKAKAQAVLDAFRLARGCRPKRSVVEGIIEAIYSDAHSERANRLALASAWSVYEDWIKGKSRVVTDKTMTGRRNLVERLVGWASDRGIVDIYDVDVSVAREYVAMLRERGLANKTLRNNADILGHVWSAVGQIVPSLHNPWRAACPDNDGSSVRREAFSAEQEADVLDAARRIGHGWLLASIVSRWTGLRYGDVARLDWASIDLPKRIISVVPAKTKRHNVSVMLPIAPALFDALSAVPECERRGLVLPNHGMTYPKQMDPPFSAVLAAAGIDGEAFSFHSWRHTFRTRLAEAGVPDEVARRMGGWTNLNMAAHYDHASHIKEMRDAIEKISQKVK